MQLGISNEPLEIPQGRTLCARRLMINPIIAYRAKFRNGRTVPYEPAFSIWLRALRCNNS